jgi:hypothetical protein
MKPIEETIGAAADTTSLVDALPLNREWLDLGVMSSTLLGVVVYLVLLVVLQSRRRGIVASMCWAFLRRHGALLEQEEGRWPLFLALCLSFASLSWLGVHVEGGVTPLVSMWRYFGLLMGYHFLVLGAVMTLGWLFGERKRAREVAARLWLCNAVVGIVLSPLVLPLFHARAVVAGALLWCAAVVLVVYAVARLWWWVKILFQHGVPIFYMILYLCALEILPLLALCLLPVGGLRDV